MFILFKRRRGTKKKIQHWIVGKIERLLDDEKVEVQIAENVNVKIVKSTISQVLSKTDTKK